MGEMDSFQLQLLSLYNMIVPIFLCHKTFKSFIWRQTRYKKSTFHQFLYQTAWHDNPSCANYAFFYKQEKLIWENIKSGFTAAIFYLNVNCHYKTVI